MGWDCTLALASALKEKGIVQRERTPIWVMVYAVYLYTLGASLQRAAEAIEAFCRRARQSVHDWVQRLGGVVREGFCLVNGPCRTA